MRFLTRRLSLLSLTMCLIAGTSLAEETRLAAAKASAITPEPANMTTPKAEEATAVNGKTDSKPTKAAARIKLVNINGASRKELMKLPGISQADADKIIVGRPYGSKAWLVTRNIIPSEVYEGIKKQIVAKQK